MAFLQAALFTANFHVPSQLNRHLLILDRRHSEPLGAVHIRPHYVGIRMLWLKLYEVVEIGLGGEVILQAIVRQPAVIESNVVFRI